MSFFFFAISGKWFCTDIYLPGSLCTLYCISSRNSKIINVYTRDANPEILNPKIPEFFGNTKFRIPELDEKNPEISFLGFIDINTNQKLTQDKTEH